MFLISGFGADTAEDEPRKGADTGYVGVCRVHIAFAGLRTRADVRPELLVRRELRDGRRHLRERVVRVPVARTELEAARTFRISG